MRDLITAGEAAKLLGVTRQTVHRWVRDGSGPIRPVAFAEPRNVAIFRRSDVLKAVTE